MQLAMPINNFKEMPNLFNAAQANKTDQAIFEAETEMQKGAETIDLDNAFAILNKKYYG